MSRDRFQDWYDGFEAPQETTARRGARELPHIPIRLLAGALATLISLSLVGGASRLGLVPPESTSGSGEASPSPGTSADPSPSPSDTPPPRTAIAGRLPIESCKIKAKLPTVLSAGFPISAYADVATTGSIKVAIAFVDFSDAPGVGSTSERFDKISSYVREAYDEMSYGKLSVTFVEVPGWIHMPEPSTAYGVLQKQAEYGNTLAYAQEVASLADELIDFSGIRTLAIFAEEQAPGVSGDYQQSLRSPIRTIEGPGITSVIVTGGQWWTTPFDWDPMTVAHEFGHVLGLQDLYGDSDNPNPYVGGFDFMSNAVSGSLSPSLLGWDRWRLGWISDADVACVQPTSDTRIHLSHIEGSDGLRLVVVPLAATQVLVFESRRAIGIDKNLTEEGVLAYIVDADIDTTDGPIRIQGDPSADFANAPYSAGEHTTIATFLIENVAAASWGDELVISP